MAERPLDRLAPQAMALTFGMAALATGVAGIAAHTFIGRPSSTSGIGIVLLLPLVLFALVIGFAVGTVLGVLLRRRGLTPPVAMGRYRLAMAFVLVVVAVAGATLGARPVIRHERLHEPRIISGAERLTREPGAQQACVRAPAARVCDLLAKASAGAITWNGREVIVGCTREGRISVSDAAAGVLASADLSDYEYVLAAHAATVQRPEGGEALALLVSLRATGRRHMFMLFDADGRPLYEELLQGRVPQDGAPLSVCRAGGDQDADRIVIDLGDPITYRPR